MSDKDSRYRFLLENANVRGVLVRLDETWREALSRAEYPPNVRRVLGHAMTAIQLMASTIKFSGKLTLQARGNGPVSLLVVQANAEGGQRGLAQWRADPPEGPLREVFGATSLTIQIESGPRSEVYQGVVEAVGDGLQDALANYFEHSEQLPTRFWLHCNHQYAAGLLLQQLPESSGAVESRADDWHRISLLADTINASELYELSPEQLLGRVFSEDEVRLYEAESMRFECNCSRERTAGLIEGLGREEAMDIVEQEGHIEIICEFCNSKNVFDSIDVETIFRGGEESPTIH
jgi:molecular chaperone Hsp33